MSAPTGNQSDAQKQERASVGDHYRKRPVVIEAVHYDGSFPLAFLRGDERVRRDPDSDGLVIYTLEGAMRCSLGDWLIRGIQGELYPCKPDIFEQTYEAVDV
jgi:hypothetical protein